MKKILLASAILLGGVGAAAAADAVVYEPAAAAYNWSGVYVGAMAGYAWGDSKYSEPDYEGYHIDYDPKGAFGGIYGGYNWQLANQVVLGIEGDFYGGDISGDSPYGFEDDAPWDDTIGTAKLKWAGSLRARAGYAIDRFMPYLTGGVAFGRYDYDVLDSSDGDGFSASKTFTGWTAGAGVEYAFTDNLIGRFEYRYTDFGKKSIAEEATNDWYSNEVKLKTNDIRFGIAYKF